MVKIKCGEAATIHDMDDLGSLAVRASAYLAAPGIHEALYRAGLTPAGADGSSEYVWLSLERLEAAAGPELHSSESWQLEWQSMISFARSKDWVSQDNTLVRAHVELE